MSRTQWNVTISGAMTASYPSPGLSGAEALQLQATNEGTSFADITVTPASLLPHGVSKGILRCLFVVQGSWGAAYPTNLFGLFFLAQEETPMGGPFTGYGVLLQHDGLTLRKADGSLPLSGASVIASHAQGYTPGALLSLEVQWEAVAGQTDIVVRRGNTATYTNVTQVLTFSDLSSPLTSGLWEGVTCRQTVGETGNLLRCQIDKTTLYTQP